MPEARDHVRADVAAVVDDDVERAMQACDLVEELGVALVPLEDDDPVLGDPRLRVDVDADDAPLGEERLPHPE